MSVALSAGLGLAESVLKIIATDVARKLITDVSDIKLQILAEEDLGYLSDDAKLETLYRKAKILIEAAKSEVDLYVSKKA